jgi:cytochrome c oxidase subunit II
VPADKAGVYRGQCAELCGPNHADMRAIVRAVPPDEFEQWARDKREQIKAAGEALAEDRKQREEAGGN